METKYGHHSEEEEQKEGDHYAAAQVRLSGAEMSSARMELPSDNARRENISVTTVRRHQQAARALQVEKGA